MTAALALLQQAAFRTPDTARYLAAGYAAIGILLAGYGLFLWLRARKLR
jgi:CHASE2 domain-containing sensor protein